MVSLLKSYIRAIGIVEPINIELIKKSKFALRHVGDVSNLRSSILLKGLIEPIVVRRVGGYFEIVAGHRRYEAFTQLGLKEIPCSIRNLSDKEAFEIALMENIQRETMKPLDEAQAFKRYVVDYGWGGVSHLARRIGKSEEYVSHRILLLNLPEEIQSKISGHQLNESAARELIWIKDRDTQLEIAKVAASKKMSVKQVRKAVKLARKGLPAYQAIETVLDEGESKSNPAISSDHTPALPGNKGKDFDNVVLTLRMALIRIDCITSEINTSEAKRVVQDIRYDLHQLLDRAIRTQAQFEK